MTDRGKSSDEDRDRRANGPTGQVPPPARKGDRLKIVLLFAVAAVLLYHVVGNLPHDVVPPAVTWQADMGKAAGVASASGKVIFADFYADWCGPCREMDHDVFSDRRFAAALEQVAVPVRVDLTGQAGQRLAARYDISAIPAYIVLSGDGTVLARAGGTKTAEELLAVVEKAAPKARADTSTR